MAFDPDAYLGTANKEFDPDAYLATDTLPEVVATQPEGGGFLAKINAALRKPSPDWLQAPEGAIRELVQEQLPHDLPSYLRSIGGPLTQGYEQAKQLEGLTRGDVSGVPLVGRIPEIAAADETPAFSKERYKTALKTLMDVGMLAGAGERAPLPLRAEPITPPELPPSPTLGPGTLAQDVSRALERRFTLQDTPPEAPPQLAPSVPIEQTLPQIPQEPPVFNPELGPTMRPEFPMPVRTETAAMPGVAELIKERQKLEAHANVSKAIGQRVAPAVEAKVAEIDQELGQPPETPRAPVPPVVEPAAETPQLIIPEADKPYAGGEQPVAPPQAVSDQPHVSAIANRFTAERAAAGELGEIAPGESINTMDLVHHGLKMSPEQVNASVSRVMQGGDVPINDVAALRGEEARLSQRSNELSRLARTSPEAQLAADNAFKDLTDFHNGPVAQAKRNWHHQGKLMQGEIPVDLSTLNGMREAWLKDTGRPPPAHIEPKLQQVADKLARAIDEERAAARNGGDAIEKATRGRKLPTAEEVRNNIAERMKVEPCIV